MLFLQKQNSHSEPGTEGTVMHKTDPDFYTVGQITGLTGVSSRALQYYDEIGLLKPRMRTEAGYRLYDKNSLELLQQILFFKELGFSLKQIRNLTRQPDFDRISAYRNQKNLLLLKRNRIDRLIQLLNRLEKGEHCMSFKEFDLSEYLEALEQFKTRDTTAIEKYFGGREHFELLLKKIREDEDEVARLAIQEYGSIEKYTEAMKHNLEHFSEIMEETLTEDAVEIGRQTDALFAQLTADLSREISSPQNREIILKLAALFQKNAASLSLDLPYWKVMADTYSNDYVKDQTDLRYGKGAADYISTAFLYFGQRGDLSPS